MAVKLPLILDGQQCLIKQNWGILTYKFKNYYF